MVQDNESHFKEPVKYYTGFEMTLLMPQSQKKKLQSQLRL